MGTVQQYRRICVRRFGYAIVPGNTDEEAIENAANLRSGDFDWEPVTPDLIREEGEVIEACGPSGESLS